VQFAAGLEHTVQLGERGLFGAAREVMKEQAAYRAIEISVGVGQRVGEPLPQLDREARALRLGGGDLEDVRVAVEAVQRRLWLRAFFAASVSVAVPQARSSTRSPARGFACITSAGLNTDSRVVSRTTGS
jgi:hypothetical protein